MGGRMPTEKTNLPEQEQAAPGGVWEIGFDPKHPYEIYDPSHPFISDEFEAELAKGIPVDE
jgi:hypothetical protein